MKFLNPLITLLILIPILSGGKVLAEPYSSRPRIQDAKPIDKLLNRLANQPLWEKELLKVNRGLIAFIAELVTLHAGQRKIVMARDMEPLFNLAQALNAELGGRSKELQSFQLINVGRLNREDPHLGDYLRDEGITAESIEKEPICLVDTGYSGTFTKELRIRFRNQAKNINLRLLGSNFDDEFPSARVFLEQLDGLSRDYNSERKKNWYDIFVNTLERMPKYFDRSTSFQLVNGKWEAIGPLSDRVERARTEEVLGYMKHYVQIEGLTRFKELRQSMATIKRELGKEPENFNVASVRKALKSLIDLDAAGFVTDLERLERNGFLAASPSRQTLAKFLLVVKEEYGDKGFPYSDARFKERIASLVFRPEVAGTLARLWQEKDSVQNLRQYLSEIKSKIKPEDNVSLLSEILQDVFKKADEPTSADFSALFDVFLAISPDSNREQIFDRFVERFMPGPDEVHKNFVDFLSSEISHFPETPSRSAKSLMLEYFNAASAITFSDESVVIWRGIFNKFWEVARTSDRETISKGFVKDMALSGNAELASVLFAIIESKQEGQKKDLAGRTEAAFKSLSHESFLKFLRTAIESSPSIHAPDKSVEPYWGFLIDDFNRRIEKRSSDAIDKDLSFCFKDLVGDAALRLFHQFSQSPKAGDPLGKSLMRLAFLPAGQSIRDRASEQLSIDSFNPTLLTLTLLDPRPEIRIKAVPSLLSVSAQRRVSEEDSLKSRIETLVSNIGVTDLSSALVWAVKGVKPSKAPLKPDTKPIAFTERQLIKITRSWPSTKGGSSYENFLKSIQAYDPILTQEILITSLQSQFLKLEAMVYIRSTYKSNPSLLEKLRVEGQDSLSELFLSTAEKYPNLVGEDLIPILSSLGNKDWSTRKIPSIVKEFTPEQHSQAPAVVANLGASHQETWSSIIRNWLSSNETLQHAIKAVELGGMRGDLTEPEDAKLVFGTHDPNLIEKYLAQVGSKVASAQSAESKELMDRLMEQLISHDHLTKQPAIMRHIEHYMTNCSVSELERIAGDLIGVLDFNTPQDRAAVMILDKRLSENLRVEKVSKILKLLGTKPFYPGTLLILMRNTVGKHFEWDMAREIYRSDIKRDELSSDLKNLLEVFLVTEDGMQSYWLQEHFKKVAKDGKSLQGLLQGVATVQKALSDLKNEKNLPPYYDVGGRLKRLDSIYKFALQGVFVGEFRDAYWDAIKTSIIDRPDLTSEDLSRFYQYIGDMESRHSQYKWNHGYSSRSCTCAEKIHTYIVETEGPNQAMIARYLYRFRSSLSAQLFQKIQGVIKKTEGASCASQLAAVGS